MWDLYWKENYGEERSCSIDEEYVRDTVIYLCAAGAYLDEIKVNTPEGSVRAHSIIKE